MFCFFFFLSPRLLERYAICHCSTREGEAWGQSSGAGVPGTVEKDLEGGQRYHRTVIIVRGTSVPNMAGFKKIKKRGLELPQRFVTFLFSFSFMQAAMKAGLSDGEIKEVLELSSSKEIKDKLKSATKNALDHGVR